ncbi:Bifunctional inhibitor/lipid-transfer protein/seed storage 2S albumin superfamily protein [Striga hermonthica]|uniref:Bifunctional inhibitor/lipid-transfer protein/seed storage 2S albumin superfamily protein n=1 Tax=Striga hermonthica TaxID=68872 RepID=A0A9N7R365_STRHE|nr:Bifunctional inhibitor/lipid-transfer protein/seed storage 2S albumin superfamily protein [Striga hermonthica]
MHRFSPRFHRPNKECCEIARKVSIPLFCKIFLIPETHMIFSASKVVIIAKDCGKPLRRHSWCGTHFVRKGPTIPPNVQKGPTTTLRENQTSPQKTNSMHPRTQFEN